MDPAISTTASLVVRKDAESENLLGHPTKLGVAVPLTEARKEKQSAIDLTGNEALDGYTGARDPLNDDPHSTVTDFARFRG
jgi:hypothetical protein